MAKPEINSGGADVGTRLRVSQKALAAALGVTSEQVRDFEAGRAEMSAAILVRAAARLKISVSALVGESKFGLIRLAVLAALDQRITIARTTPALAKAAKPKPKH